MTARVEVVIIGGMGMTANDYLTGAERVAQDTPWGKVSLWVGKVEGHNVGYLARFGEAEPYLLPPMFNYCGNIWACQQLGAQRIICVNPSGSLTPSITPGAIVIPHDFIDLTKQRPLTYFDAPDAKRRVRVDMATPFCPEVRAALIRAAEANGTKIVDGGVTVTVEGPRLETPAEIRMFRQLGGDVIGTFVATEAVLARELELCYAVVAPIVDYAAGVGDSVGHVRWVEIDRSKDRNIVVEATGLLPAQHRCPCKEALSRPSYGARTKPAAQVG